MSLDSTPHSEPDELRRQILEKCKAVWRLGRGTALDLPLDPELLPEDATEQIMTALLAYTHKRVVEVLEELEKALEDLYLATYPITYIEGAVAQLKAKHKGGSDGKTTSG